MDDKIVHTLQLAMVLSTAIILIIFANKEIDPMAVYTGMIAGIGGIVGTRIASNGYNMTALTKKATTPGTTPTQATTAGN